MHYVESEVSKTEKLDPDEIIDFADYKEQIEAEAWVASLQQNDDGNVKSSSAANAATILANDADFSKHLKFNEFSNVIEVDGDISTDNFSHKQAPGTADSSLMSDLKIMTDDKYQATFSTELITGGAMAAAKLHAYNPLTDYLTAAEEAWKKDGSTERLANIFIDTLGAPKDDATRVMTKLFFSGLVCRAHKPGTKFDYMTVLYSQKQGIGKTWLLNKIGGQWYTDSLLDMKSKDSAQIVAQKWLVNDDELAVTTDHRTNSFAVVKSFITRQNDEFRAPYTPTVVNFPRRFILAGTTNEQNILKDVTGSRRMNIIRCGEGTITKPVAKLTANDILLYLGEAENWYQNGKTQLVATPEEQALIDKAKTDFESTDSTEEDIQLILNALYPSQWWQQTRDIQRTYVAKILDGTSDDTPGIDKLDRVSVRWLLDIGFNLDHTRSGTAQYRTMEAKVRVIMDNMTGWRKTNGPIKIGLKKARGYQRV
ncbi:VapE family protein [Lacticaseibacillus pabuli]|uniref:VapE family protein n=1 Tax=Lacticaseibacillus pabuli TaxID=3025672 RepID=A0ABY7WQJ7_9LACO|nr:VapE domain-containing protein [Lacticaseibacillus sp. KACC 23028]WDF82054.1 VapE family protein [Lacticaseibacillus sp. KACC 23028]